MSLSPSRKQEVESITNDILKSVFGDINSILPPIDLNKILDHYGLDLKAGKFDDTSIAGAYDREKHTIYLAEDDPIQRQAFTTAHELGHFILHKNKAKGVFKRVQAIQLDSAASEDRDEETEANFFAASLLMPRDLVRKYWPIVKDLEHISTLFGVSETAVRWRLKHLGFIE